MATTPSLYAFVKFVYNSSVLSLDIDSHRRSFSILSSTPLSNIFLVRGVVFSYFQENEHVALRFHTKRGKFSIQFIKISPGATFSLPLAIDRDAVNDSAIQAMSVRHNSVGSDEQNAFRAKVRVNFQGQHSRLDPHQDHPHNRRRRRYHWQSSSPC